MLLTDKIPDLEFLFEDRKHLVTYEDEKDLLEKVKYYLKNDTKRQEIAEAGREEVQKHSYFKRFEEILKWA